MNPDVRRTKPQERISPAGVAAVGVGLVLIVATGELPEGSAAFPRMIGLAMLVLGSLEVVRVACFGPNPAEREQQQRLREESVKAPLKPVLIFIAATLVYVLVMPLVGFYTTTLLYLVLTMVLLGVRKISLFVVVPVVMISVLYFGFTTQLQVPLPQGALL